MGTAITSLTGLIQNAVDSSYSDDQIKTKYENNDDTNAFTDAEKVKVSNISVTRAVDLDAIESNTNLNNAHKVSDGSDHGFIDQDVTTTADVVFNSIVVADTVNGRDIASDGTAQDSHIANMSNPHEVTKAQVGLGNVDNTADVDKSVNYAASAGTSAALTGAQADAIAVNTAKVTNVTTDLSKTVTETDVTIVSSDGTDVAIEAASSSAAGVMTKAMYDEHVVNNAKVSDINHNVTTNLSVTTAESTVTVISSDGTDAELPAATTNDAGVMTSTDKSKLDGVESGATADQTASEILAAIKTVDGAGSGLDADLLDDQEGSYYRNASNLNAGTISVNRLPATISSDTTGTATNADKLDGQHGSYYTTCANSSVVATGNLSSITVQSALEELQGDIDTINTIIGVN